MSNCTAQVRSVSIGSALVVDDHPLYCDALAATMENIFETRKIRTATTIGDGLRQLRSRFTPDVVILDLNLPDVSGLSGFIKIKEKVPDVPVIIVSATSSDAIVQSVMSAGAAGFIPKDTSREVFRSAIIDIWDGKTYVPPSHKTSDTGSAEDMSIEQASRKIANLSQQQGKILNLICMGKPNKLIAYEMSLAEATVKAHITALLRRLGVQNRTQAALLLREASIRNDLQ